MAWFKGNLHTHTTESDGDAEPEEVVRWYRRHGYDFLVLSDHNHLTLLEYGEGKRRLKRPLMIPGEEVSAQILNGSVPIHLGGIGISRLVEPIDADGVVATIQANVNAIVEAGGIASINHPNFKWAFDHHALKQVSGATLLEVFNGHPGTNNGGGPGRYSTEQIWDGVLSADRPIFGVAVDDSHAYHDFSFDSRGNPGRGWVVVRAKEASRDAIVDGLASGDFYSSSGVELADLHADSEGISIAIDPFREGAYGMEYVTRFTGRDGVPIAEAEGLNPEYTIAGDEVYVRATVTSSNGHKAWVQPVFVPDAG